MSQCSIPPCFLPRRLAMNVEKSTTETIVRNHLEAFLEQKGVNAIVGDYDEDAGFLTEDRIYRGKQEIRGFFRGFLASLPAGLRIISRSEPSASTATSHTSP